jgi:DNA polymerase elongation subunit (family B)
VFVYDFASMYPAIIQALQLCPSSIYDGDETELEVLLARGEIRGERVAVNDSADVFRVSEYRGRPVVGCLPNIIRRGVEARKAVRASLAQLAPMDPFTATLEALQQQIKRLTNAWYGLTGNEGSILTHVVTAAATTRRGREDIQRAEQYIVDRESEGKLPAGTRVVYMDTDSCFVFWPLQDLEGLPGALAGAKKLLADLNSLYCAPCKMELERVFTQINIRGKKKYTGLGGEASEAGVRAALEGRTAPISKGMVANKRSVCALVAAASSEVEAALLRDQPLEVVLASVERYAANIQERAQGSVQERAQSSVQERAQSSVQERAQSSVDSFSLSCALAREYTNEETTVGPRLKRRYKDRFQFDLAARTRVPYVVAKGSGLLADRVRFPDEVSAAELDTEYYLKQLASTLRQTCEGYAAVGGAVAAALAKAIGQNRARQMVSAGAQRALSVLLRPRQPAQNAAPILAAAVPATPATATLPQENQLPAPKRPATSHAVPFAKRPRLAV